MTSIGVNDLRYQGYPVHQLFLLKRLICEIKGCAITSLWCTTFRREVDCSRNSPRLFLRGIVKVRIPFRFEFNIDLKRRTFLFHFRRKSHHNPVRRGNKLKRRKAYYSRQRSDITVSYSGFPRNGTHCRCTTVLTF